jgi:hypothetical protein
MWLRLKTWLRKHGLAPFGFTQNFLNNGVLLVRVWGPFLPARWEVRRWMLGSREHAEAWLAPLPPGSSERYHRIEFSSRLLYAGNDYYAVDVALDDARA